MEDRLEMLKAGYRKELQSLSSNITYIVTGPKANMPILHKIGKTFRRAEKTRRSKIPLLQISGSLVRLPATHPGLLLFT
eukprot:5907979-Pleurochrysis_carterae.AAC.1